jgi:ribosomal protein S18 acetylase RimI-like enzyme
MVGAECAGILHIVPWRRSLTIRWLMIEPTFQGCGIGTQLVRLVQREALDQDRSVRLEVLTCNVDAKRLYERLGFGSSMVLAHSTWMQWPADPADVS